LLLVSPVNLLRGMVRVQTEPNRQPLLWAHSRPKLPDSCRACPPTSMSEPAIRCAATVRSVGQGDPLWGGRIPILPGANNARAENTLRAPNARAEDVLMEIIETNGEAEQPTAACELSNLLPLRQVTISSWRGEYRYSGQTEFRARLVRGLIVEP